MTRKKKPRGMDGFTQQSPLGAWGNSVLVREENVEPRIRILDDAGNIMEVTFPIRLFIPTNRTRDRRMAVSLTFVVNETTPTWAHIMVPLDELSESRPTDWTSLTGWKSKRWFRIHPDDIPALQVRLDEVMERNGLAGTSLSSAQAPLSSSPDWHTEAAQQKLEETQEHLRNGQEALERHDCPYVDIFLDAANQSYGAMGAHMSAGGVVDRNQAGHLYIELVELTHRFHELCLSGQRGPPDEVDKWFTRTMRKTARRERGEEAARPVVSLERFKKLKREGLDE